MKPRMCLLALTWLAAASCEAPTHRNASQAARAEPVVPTSIAWTSYEDAVARAGTEGKPIILVFTASWCSQCRAYQAVLDDPDVIAMSQRFLMVRVDIDQRRDLNATFDFDGQYVPRTIFVRPDGSERRELRAAGRTNFLYFVNPRDRSDLLGLMRRALES